MTELLKQPACFASACAIPKRPTRCWRNRQAVGATAQTVAGVTTYTLQLAQPQLAPPQSGQTNGGPALGLAFSIAEGSLMVSTSPEYLQSLIAGRAKLRPLAETPRFKQATGRFPQKTSLLSYTRQDRRFERLYEEIRSGGFRLPLYGGIVTGLGLDFSKLPPAKAIRPYLQTSAGYIEPADKGFRMIDIGYWPRRPSSPTKTYDPAPPSSPSAAAPCP